MEGYSGVHKWKDTVVYIEGYSCVYGRIKWCIWKNTVVYMERYSGVYGRIQWCIWKEPPRMSQLDYPPVGL